jgi:hypothetical protein
MITFGLRPNEGAYANASPSGLLTTVAAGTASAGHIWAFQWPAVTAAQANGGESRKFAIIQRLRVRAFTITGFTAAQEVRFALFKLTGYTAPHTGGVATVVPSTKRTGTAAGVVPPSIGAMPASRAVIQVGNTGALTDGTHDAPGDPIRTMVSSELAAAATVQKGVIDGLMSTEDIIRHPFELQENEGLMLRNEVLMGAGGTMRLAVELDWFEVERQPEFSSL